MTIKQILKNLEHSIASNRLLVESGHKKEKIDSFAVSIRTDDAERLVRYLKRKGKRNQRMHFVCPDCGPHVKADEDGCCRYCGRDCKEAACRCSAARKLKLEGKP